MLVEMVSDGLAEWWWWWWQKEGDGSTTQKDTAASVWARQPHTADSCEAEPESNRASLPLTASPLPPAGENIGEEEQKKEVKRPYAACVRAESRAVASSRRSKIQSLKKAKRTQEEPSRLCVPLVFRRMNVLKREKCSRQVNEQALLFYINIG